VKVGQGETREIPPGSPEFSPDCPLSCFAQAKQA